MPSINPGGSTGGTLVRAPSASPTIAQRIRSASRYLGTTDPYDAVAIYDIASNPGFANDADYAQAVGEYVSFKRAATLANRFKRLGRNSTDNQWSSAMRKWDNLSDSQRQVLMGLGVTDPNRLHAQYEDTGHGPFGIVGDAFGEIMDVPLDGFKWGLGQAKNAGGFALEALNKPIEGVKWAYRVGSIAAGGDGTLQSLLTLGGAAAGIALTVGSGGTLAPLGLAVAGGLGAMGAITAQGAIGAAIDPDRLAYALDVAGEGGGEKAVHWKNRQEALELLDGNAALYEKARTIMATGDVQGVAVDMAIKRMKRQGIRNPQADPTFGDTVKEAGKILESGKFRDAVAILQEGKVSPGRDLAHGIGMSSTDSNILGFTNGYNLISGLGDMAFTLATDPILIGGKVLKTVRAARGIASPEELVSHITGLDSVVSSTDRIAAAEALGARAAGRAADVSLASGAADSGALTRYATETLRVHQGNKHAAWAQSVVDLFEGGITKEKVLAWHRLYPRQGAILDTLINADRKLRLVPASARGAAAEAAAWRRAQEVSSGIDFWAMADSLGINLQDTAGDALRMAQQIDTVEDARYFEDLARLNTSSEINDGLGQWDQFTEWALKTDLARDLISGRAGTQVKIAAQWPTLTRGQIERLRVKYKIEDVVDGLYKAPDTWFNRIADDLAQSEGPMDAAKLRAIQSARRAGHFTGNLAKAVTQQVPRESFLSVYDPRGADRFEQFLRIYTDYGEAGDIYSQFMVAANAAERRNVVANAMRAMISRWGVSDDFVREWTEGMVKRNLKYSPDRRLSLRPLGDVELPMAIWDHQLATDAIALPSLRSVEKAIRRNGTLQTLGHNVIHSDLTDNVMARVWKPMVLLRLGFIPRAAGEELLSFIGRFGPVPLFDHYFTVPLLARPPRGSAQEWQVIGPLRWMARAERTMLHHDYLGKYDEILEARRAVNASMKSGLPALPEHYAKIAGRHIAEGSPYKFTAFRKRPLYYYDPAHTRFTRNFENMLRNWTKVLASPDRIMAAELQLRSPGLITAHMEPIAGAQHMIYSSDEYFGDVAVSHDEFSPIDQRGRTIPLVTDRSNYQTYLRGDPQAARMMDVEFANAANDEARSEGFHLINRYVDSSERAQIDAILGADSISRMRGAWERAPREVRKWFLERQRIQATLSAYEVEEAANRYDDYIDAMDESLRRMHDVPETFQHGFTGEDLDAMILWHEKFDDLTVDNRWALMHDGRRDFRFFTREQRANRLARTELDPYADDYAEQVRARAHAADEGYDDVPNMQDLDDDMQLSYAEHDNLIEWNRQELSQLHDYYTDQARVREPDGDGPWSDARRAVQNEIEHRATIRDRVDEALDAGMSQADNSAYIDRIMEAGTDDFEAMSGSVLVGFRENVRGMDRYALERYMNTLDERIEFMQRSVPEAEILADFERARESAVTEWGRRVFATPEGVRPTGATNVDVVGNGDLNAQVQSVIDDSIAQTEAAVNARVGQPLEAATPIHFDRPMTPDEIEDYVADHGFPGRDGAIITDEFGSRAWASYDEVHRHFREFDNSQWETYEYRAERSAETYNQGLLPQYLDPSADQNPRVAAWLDELGIRGRVIGENTNLTDDVMGRADEIMRRTGEHIEMDVWDPTEYQALERWLADFEDAVTEYRYRWGSGFAPSGRTLPDGRPGYIDENGNEVTFLSRRFETTDEVPEVGDDLSNVYDEAPGYVPGDTLAARDEYFATLDAQNIEDVHYGTDYWRWRDEAEQADPATLAQEWVTNRDLLEQAEYQGWDLYSSGDQARIDAYDRIAWERQGEVGAHLGGDEQAYFDEWASYTDRTSLEPRRPAGGSGGGGGDSLPPSGPSTPPPPPRPRLPHIMDEEHQHWADLMQRVENGDREALDEAMLLQQQRQIARMGRNRGLYSRLSVVEGQPGPRPVPNNSVRLYVPRVQRDRIDAVIESLRTSNDPVDRALAAAALRAHGTGATAVADDAADWVPVGYWATSDPQLASRIQRRIMDPNYQAPPTGEIPTPAPGDIDPRLGVLDMDSARSAHFGPLTRGQSTEYIGIPPQYFTDEWLEQYGRQSVYDFDMQAAHEMARTRVDDLVLYGFTNEGRPTRGITRSIGARDWATEDLYIGATLPERVIGPAKVAFNDNWFNQFVRWGFDRIIAPAITAIVRRPLFNEQFTIGMKEALRVLGPNLRPDATQIDEFIRLAGISDADEFMRHMDPIMRYAQSIDRPITSAQDFADVYTDWYRRQTGEHLLDDDMDLAIAPMLRRDVRAQAKRARVRPDLKYNPVSKVAKTLQDATDDDRMWLDEIVRKAVRFWNSEDDALRQITEVAAERAFADAVGYIDDHNIRSIMAENIRNIVPFYFAEEQFIKRWVRTIAYDPASVHKIQLLKHGLQSVGFIKTDPESGQDYFHYPFSAPLNSALGRLAEGITGQPHALPMSVPMTGQVRYALPGFDNLGVPSVGPLVAIPLSAMANRFPELQGAEYEILGERAAGRGFINHVVPTSVRRFYDAFTARPDSNREMASAMMSAIQYLEATGKAPADDASPIEHEKFLDRVENWTRVLMLTKAAVGFTGPAAPSPESPGKEFVAEFQGLLRDLPLADAIETFMDRYPDATPYTVFQSKTPSKAYMPATQRSLDWMVQNQDLLGNYPMGAPWLLPQPDDEDAFSSRAYNQQVAVGMRERRLPDEYYREVKYAKAAPEYFRIRDKFQKRIDLQRQAGNSAGAAVQEQAFGRWRQSYLAQHPIFAEMLLSPTGRQDRENILNDLYAMLDDKRITAKRMPVAMRDLLDRYGVFRSQMDQMKYLRGTRAASLRAGIRRQAYFDLDDYSRRNPSVRALYLRVMLPDLDVDEAQTGG